jgi:hypothetical protein
VQEHKFIPNLNDYELCADSAHGFRAEDRTRITRGSENINKIASAFYFVPFTYS